MNFKLWVCFRYVLGVAFVKDQDVLMALTDFAVVHVAADPLWQCAQRLYQNHLIVQHHSSVQKNVLHAVGEIVVRPAGATQIAYHNKGKAVRLEAFNRLGEGCA